MSGTTRQPSYARVVALMTVLAVSRVAWASGDIVISTNPSSGIVSSGSVLSCTASSCVLNNSDLEIALTGGSVTVQSAATGNITVSAAITWPAAVTLTLQAQKDVVVQAHITATNGTLVMRADAACQQVGKILASAGVFSVPAITALAYDASDLSVAVTSGSLSQSQLVDTLAQLQTIGPTGMYALGCDLSDVVSGYVPIGPAAAPFTGTLDGMGHAVLRLSVSAAAEAGVFGVLGAGSVVRNLVLVSPSVSTSGSASGALVGSATSATIANVAVLGATINGTTNTGGLVGYAKTSSINGAYVTGRVTGTSSVGGVAGSVMDSGAVCSGSGSMVTNIASKAAVIGDGSGDAGGLVGNNCSTIARGWSAGAVTNGAGAAGGAIGHDGTTTTTALYWDTQTSGVSGGLTTAQTHAAASFAGFDFTATWAIREGYGRPFLRSLQSLLDVAMTESSTGPSVATEPVTFTATIQGLASYAAPQGVVSFFDGGASAAAPLLGTATVSATPIQLTSAALTTGSHAVIVYFPGDAFFSENTASVSQLVSLAASSMTLAANAGPVLATVSPVAPATGTPTGSVSFTVDGSATPTVVPLVGGVAALDTSALASGSHTVRAAYAGDAAFASSSAVPITVRVSGQTTTALTVASASSAYGEAVTLSVMVSSADGVPTGVVDFIADGSTMLGEVQLSSGTAMLNAASLSAGTHTLTARYMPDAPAYAASISAPASHLVTQATSAAHLQVLNIVDGVVNLSVNVVPVPATPDVPTGSVVFTVDGADVATVALQSGVATYATAILSQGSHVIAARYSGDIDYVGSATDPQSVDVEPSGFQLAVSPGRAQVLVGGSASFVVSLTQEASDFAEEVTFACSDLPPNAECSFSPAATTVSARGTNVNLLITTQTAIASGPVARLSWPSAPLLAGLALVAGGLALAGRRRRFAIAGMICAALACDASGNGPELVPREGTPSGMYTITIQGKSANYLREGVIELDVK